MKLTVQERNIIGRKVKGLRASGIVPGVIYGKHMGDSESFSVSRIEFLRVFSKTGRSTPIELSGDGMDHLVLVQDLQLDPVSDEVIHIDLRAVKKDEKVTAQVPIILEGISPYEKGGLGRVQLILSEVEVEAFPLDLPHDIKIDISNMTEEGQVIHLSDIILSDKVKFMDELSRTVLVTVAFAEEEEEVVDELAEGEEAAEGEEGAEGESTEESSE